MTAPERLRRVAATIGHDCTRLCVLDENPTICTILGKHACIADCPACAIEQIAGQIEVEQHNLQAALA